MSKYTIREISSKRDIRKFIKFPDRLYRDCPQYVPALHGDQMKSLTSCATLAYCKRKLWMVYDEKGEIVGRISGMINPRYNEFYSKKRARFGWFDTIDDIEVAKLLLSTAEAWAREEGMTEIHGPLYYNTMGKQGMLVEGFENIPVFNCLYNFSYYKDFVEQLKRPDVVFLAEIFAAREQNTIGISSASLADEIDGARFFPTFEELEAELRRAAEPGDIILTVGAGDVYRIGEHLVAEG